MIHSTHAMYSAIKGINTAKTYKRSELQKVTLANYNGQ